MVAFCCGVPGLLPLQSRGQGWCAAAASAGGLLPQRARFAFLLQRRAAAARRALPWGSRRRRARLRRRRRRRQVHTADEQLFFLTDSIDEMKALAAVIEARLPLPLPS